MASLTMTRRTFAKVAAATAAAAGLGAGRDRHGPRRDRRRPREGQRGQAHPFRLPRLRQDGMPVCG